MIDILSRLEKISPMLKQSLLPNSDFAKFLETQKNLADSVQKMSQEMIGILGNQ